MADMTTTTHDASADLGPHERAARALCGEPIRCAGKPACPRCRQEAADVLQAACDGIEWADIHAFEAILRNGQDVREDAGGFMVRAIRALFGATPRDPVLTYRDATRALFKGIDHV